MKTFNVGDTVFFDYDVTMKSIRHGKRNNGTVKFVLTPEITGFGFTHYVIHLKGWPDDELVIKTDNEVYSEDSSEWESFKSSYNEVKELYKTTELSRDS